MTNAQLGGFLLVCVAVFPHHNAVNSAPGSCSTSADCKSGFFCHIPISFCVSCTSICDLARIRSPDHCNREDNCVLHRPGYLATTTRQAGALSSHATPASLSSALDNSDHGGVLLKYVTIYLAILVVFAVVLLILGIAVYRCVKSKLRIHRNRDRETEANIVLAVQEQRPDTKSAYLVTNVNQ